MNEINWNRFVLKNSNPQKAFETMCRNLFLRKYKVGSYDFSANFNQAGLETEPIIFEDKYYGFQCKYSESGNGDALYKEVFSSLGKAVKLYPMLNTAIIYTNLDIKPNVTADDLKKKRKSNRVKIYELGLEHNVKINWFVKPNFEQALNETNNFDLFRTFFSSQDTYGLLNDALTNSERTFLISNQFIDLSLNGTKFSVLQEEILAQKFSIITGAAGTGKSELLKKLYLECENKHLSNINQTPSNANVPIPVLIRMRECVNGDLEGLLRNRLKDFEINIASEKNNYVYFFDGLDEVNSLDFNGVISSITRLNYKKSTNAIVLSSRTNTANLTTTLRICDAKVYTIDSLKIDDVDNYFNRLNNSEKQKKLYEIKSSHASLYEDITDIFSITLLSENIFQISNATTKVDLIKLNAENLIENNRKYSSINLPEPKTHSVERLLAKVSELMHSTGNISVDRVDLQEIITELFPLCNYYQTDEIIDFLCEMFFDSSSSQNLQRRYSYRHKRYFEFYLYTSIKSKFYDKPSILRELRLLSNKDFLLNIFLVQELKENILNNNMQHVLALRFFEAYLGEDYMRGAKSTWFMDESLLTPSSDSYLQSDQLREYLCTKNPDILRDFLINDPLSIRCFLTQDNYYNFVKQYHTTNKIDIRKCLHSVYDFQGDWLKNAAKKDLCSFMYCKCVIEKYPISEFYKTVCGTNDKVRTIDLDCYPYNHNSSATIVNLFELAVNHFYDWLQSIISDISINHLEVLCYVLLRYHNLRCILKTDENQSSLIKTICERISANSKEQYGIHTIVLYGLITGNIIQKTDIESREAKVNKGHLETWRNNFELNSYVGVILGEEFHPYHSDYKLGVSLRGIVQNYYPSKKSEMLPIILQEINKFNLIYKNWFSYNNAKFIGEILSSLDLNIDEIKSFVIELRKYDSVVSTFQILYTIMVRNADLFKTISNPCLISSEYDKASKSLSYYDYNSDLGFMYATMISCFDITKADALFEQAVNNSIFRPAFRHEDMIDYQLPICLLLAHNNCWVSSEELEKLTLRVYHILKISKDTLDSGAYSEYFKYLVEKCCPNLLELIGDFSADAKNPEKIMGWESCNNSIPTGNITSENLSEYYECKVEGINYSSVSVWKNLIEYELNEDSTLKILYQTLEKNYFPNSYYSKISHCFHIIIAILMSNVKTKTDASEFIMKHAGRMGFVILTKAFALIGDDQSGRRHIEQLLKLCEAMVYPSSKHLKNVERCNYRDEKIISMVCNSKTNDWKQDVDNNIMHYIPDSKITIKWDDYEEHQPFNDEWATNHPSKEAYSTKYYIYYENELIKDFDMVHVDGYRALIPMPNYTTNHIERKNYKFACLVNNTKETLNSYIARSGLIVD